MTGRHILLLAKLGEPQQFVEIWRLEIEPGNLDADALPAAGFRLGHAHQPSPGAGATQARGHEHHFHDQPAIDDAAPQAAQDATIPCPYQDRNGLNVARTNVDGGFPIQQAEQGGKIILGGMGFDGDLSRLGLRHTSLFTTPALSGARDCVDAAEGLASVSRCIGLFGGCAAAAGGGWREADILAMDMTPPE
jgi:hypothetical protein